MLSGAALGAGRSSLKLVRDGWNGFNVLHTSASRMAGLILGYAQKGGIADLEEAKPEVVLLLGADEVDPTRFAGSFKVYIGHHGDNGARQADLVLPGAAYAEKHGTYVNTEGRVQRTERAAFAPGEAREDWTIFRAVSELARSPLPFDRFDQLRARMVADHPQLGRDGLIALAWSPPKLAAKAEGADRLPDPRLLPDQRDLPLQPDHAALLGGVGPWPSRTGGRGMTAWFQSFGIDYEWSWFIATIIGILVIALPLMLAVAMIIYAERKIWAAIALRRGPNVVGPWGLLQSFADGLKVFLKETIIPTSANKGLFLIAPIITFTVALIVWAVIPFDDGVVLANINVGLLYVLAASSLGVYGVIVAGWASNSKYPFFSALRAAAQMVSYEVSIGFVLICVVLYANSFNLTEIVLAQQGHSCSASSTAIGSIPCCSRWRSCS